jgi:predicted nucleic acid-binding protein
MKNKIEIYKKQSIFAELKDFCHLSKEGAFIELTEWKEVIVRKKLII